MKRPGRLATATPSDARLRAMTAVLLRASAEGPIGLVEDLVRATRGLERPDRRRLQAVLDEAMGGAAPTRHPSTAGRATSPPS